MYNIIYALYICVCFCIPKHTLYVCVPSVSVYEVAQVFWPDLAKLLSQFISLIHKKDHEESPNNFRHFIIVSGLQQYLVF